MNQSSAIVIDGKKIAAEFKSKFTKQLIILQEEKKITPGLAVILVGEDPASEVYVRNKLRFTREVGIHSFEFKMPHSILQKNLISKIEHLNNDPKVHGILVQLPLPQHINETAVINAINPDKDVDGFHVSNVGKLATNQEGFVPCTPLGCLRLIKTIQEDLTGLKAVVIGRSNIVGKPMAALLLRENCTITMLHSKSLNIPEEVKQADIVIAAVGIAQFVKGAWIKPGAIVIDVGINRISTPSGTKLIGDVEFEEAIKVAKAITPVPGGVGPMTIISLLENTIKAAIQQKQNLSKPL
jgi:methylenetetrahydrofolate dehydrogenase (NADP+)/methenyltetrahydrofolate cyclohydrolase